MASVHGCSEARRVTTKYGEKLAMDVTLADGSLWQQKPAVITVTVFVDVMSAVETLFPLNSVFLFFALEASPDTSGHVSVKTTKSFWWEAASDSLRAAAVKRARPDTTAEVSSLTAPYEGSGVDYLALEATQHLFCHGTFFLLKKFRSQVGF